MFIDAIHVKVRDGQVTNRPVYVAIGVTVNGERDILGLWAGDGGEGAKFWLSVLTEIKNRGVEDVCITVCDGLKGLPEAITTVWQLAVVQTCIVHLIRNTFRYAASQYWDEMSRDLRPVYTAPSEAAAKERFTEFSGKWGKQYLGDHPAVGERLVRVRTVPGLRRRNPSSHLQHERHRIRQRPLPACGQGQGPFPHRAGRPEMPLPRHPGAGPTGKGRARWATRWKPALNAFAITFDGRIN